jgi:hypothetical protein
MLCLHAPAPEGHRYSSRINIAETTTQQESATVHFIGVEQTTEWLESPHQRRGSGSSLLRKQTDRRPLAYPLPLLPASPAFALLLKICQTTRRERLFLLSPRFDTKTWSFRTKPEAR